MAFWRSFSFNTSSPIDEALKGPDCTLEKLLDIDQDLISEAKLLNNKKLFEFLEKDESLKKLISYVTVDPSINDSEKRRIKYPEIACDLLALNIPNITDKILGNEELLEKLFSFLFYDKYFHVCTPEQKDSVAELPVEPNESSDFVPGIRVVQLGFCAKIVKSMMKSETASKLILDFLKSKNDAVSRIANRADQPEVNEFIFKLITIPKCKDVGMWLNENNFVGTLISKLEKCIETEEMQVEGKEKGEKAESEADEQSTSSIIPLSDPADGSIIVIKLLQKIVDCFDKKRSSSILSDGEDLDIQILLQSPQQQKALLLEQEMINDSKRETLEPILKAILANVDKLAKIFFQEKYPVPVFQASLSFFRSVFHYVAENREEKVNCEQFADLFKNLFARQGGGVLGLTRLRAVEATTELVRCDLAYLSNELLDAVVKLFFDYPWNSFLHRSVTSIVMYVVDNDSDRTKRDYLLFTSKFIEKSLDAAFDTEQNKKSGGAQSNASIVGYLGFVAVMFREFLNRAENDKDFDKLLHETPRFDEYVTEILKPEEKKEQTNLGVDEHSESGQVDDFDYTRSESEDDNDSDDEEFNDRNSDSMINDYSSSSSDSEKSDENEDDNVDDEDEKEEEEEDNENTNGGNEENEVEAENNEKNGDANGSESESSSDEEPDSSAAAEEDAVDNE